MNKYSIGQLSKTFSLTSEAIRFYEKKGLLIPSRGEDGMGYRHYTSVDFQRVASLKRLQNEGFCLDEIHSMHTGVSEKHIESFLENKVEQLTFEVTYQQRMLARLQEIHHQMSHLDEYLLTPQLIDFEPIYFRFFDCIDDLWQAVSKDETLQTLFKHLPLASISTPVSCFELRNNAFPKQRGITAPESFVNLLGLSLPESFVRIDASKAIRIVFRIENGHTNREALLTCVRKALTKDHQTVKDLLFTRLLTNYIDTDGMPIQYSELYIPLVIT